MTLTLQNRLDLLSELGHYISSGGDEELDVAVRLSYTENQWFTEENTRESLCAISGSFLDAEKLRAWASAYDIPEENHHSKVVGLIMAGNIPLVGFHDWLCVLMVASVAGADHIHWRYRQADRLRRCDCDGQQQHGALF